MQHVPLVGQTGQVTGLLTTQPCLLAARWPGNQASGGELWKPWCRRSAWHVPPGTGDTGKLTYLCCHFTVTLPEVQHSPSLSELGTGEASFSVPAADEVTHKPAFTTCVLVTATLPSGSVFGVKGQTEPCELTVNQPLAPPWLSGTVTYVRLDTTLASCLQAEHLPEPLLCARVWSTVCICGFIPLGVSPA